MRLKPSTRSFGPSLPRVPFALALRRRPRLRSALAMAAAVVIGLLVAGSVSRAERVRAAWGRSQTVVVATRDLPAGHVVGAGDTGRRRAPAGLVPPGALASAPTGRAVRVPVLEGEIVLDGHIATGDAVGVAARLPAGTRAVAIPIEAGTAPPLRVGQRVDVVAVAAAGDDHPPGFLLAEAVPVVDVREGAASVAVDRQAVPRIALALAAGAVSLAVVAP